MSKLSIKAIAIATVIGGAILGATLASAALVLPTQNCSYSFTRNFTMGSTGTDVMNLQKVLNAYPQTKVSDSGAGSPGMESTYYGAKTKAAVIKFQELHMADILTPVGLTAGNGNVYSGTRSVLNQICTGVAGTQTTSTVAGCTSTVGFSPLTGQSCASGAVVSTTLPAGCTSAVGFSPTTGQSCASGSTPVTSTGPVSVSLAGNQPQQMIVLGQSGAKLADFVFTGNGTVTNVQFQRIGISIDAALTNVYLYDGNTRITDAASVVTGGYINFNSPAGLFTVNGSRTLSVRADIATTASLAGNSVGVKLNSVTTTGGSAATFTNVQGNQLVLANVATAAVNIAALSQGALTVDAGTTNYNVWSGSATVSTRAVNLKAATFKFVGSAPYDALANISLYIDGAKVGSSSTINPANNNKVTFDLGATPLALTTGAHTMDVRADIVKGSYRTITMSIENVSDLMIEDSMLAGVNISATIAVATFTQSAATYGQITVNRGSVSVSTDPSFVTSKVTGGATSVPVGQFTMRAYGEDVKVTSLQVTFATTTVTTLNNVSLFVNGGQVGTSQNFLGTAKLSYTLGSSLIIPANTTVTLTVKADVVNASNAAYTSGTIAAVIGGVSSNAQGQSSYEVLSVAPTAVTGSTLTVSSGAGSFARTSGFTATTLSPNTNNVKIGSFTLQANSSESVKVNSIGVNPIVSGYDIVNANTINNYQNLTLKTGSTILGTPVNPVSGTTTFSFNEIVIPANGTQTFDVYADIQGNASSTLPPVVTTAMSVTYRGSVSNTTTVSDAAGVAITSVAATLAVPTLVSSSPVAQYVVGGSTFGIATFKLATAAAGTQATVRELRFITTGQDAITGITVGGIYSPVLGSGAAATTTVSGLNINIDANGTSVPVTVQFANFAGASTNPGTLTTSNIASSITLGYIEGTKSGQTQITGIASNAMQLVASKPTVTVSSGLTNAVTLSSVAESKVGEFTVTADANGKIAVASTSLSLSVTGLTAGYEITGARITDGGTTVVGSSLVAGATSSTTPVFTFVPAYEIGAGQSKTFSVFAKVNGALSGSNAAYVTSILTSGATFKWVDVLGGSTVLTGASLYNFPTNSYSTTH